MSRQRLIRFEREDGHLFSKDWRKVPGVDMRSIQKDLKVPLVCNEYTKETWCFFTLEGLDRFKDNLRAMLGAEPTIRATRVWSDEGTVVYQDAHQVVFLVGKREVADYPSTGGRPLPKPSQYV